MWHRVAQLLRHDFFLVLPDLRGYGDSSHAPGLPDHSNYSKRALAQDLIAVMDTLGIAAFALCGHDRAAAWRTGWRWTTRRACAGSA